MKESIKLHTMAKLTVDHVFVRVFASVQVVDGEKRIIN